MQAQALCLQQRTSTITITTVFIQIKVSWPRSRLQVDYFTGPPTPSHFRLLTCVRVCGEVYNLMCFFVYVFVCYTLTVSENHGMWYETDYNKATKLFEVINQHFFKSTRLVQMNDYVDGWLYWLCLYVVIMACGGGRPMAYQLAVLNVRAAGCLYGKRGLKQRTNKRGTTHWKIQNNIIFVFWIYL